MFLLSNFHPIFILISLSFPYHPHLHLTAGTSVFDPLGGVSVCVCVCVFCIHAFSDPLKRFLPAIVTCDGSFVESAGLEKVKKFEMEKDHLTISSAHLLVLTPGFYPKVSGVSGSALSICSISFRGDGAGAKDGNLRRSERTSHTRVTFSRNQSGGSHAVVTGFQSSVISQLTGDVMPVIAGWTRRADL